MKKILILFLLLPFLTLSQNVIHIVPMGNIDNELLNTVGKSVKNFYGFSYVIDPKYNPPDYLLAKSKKKYDASKILNEFSSFKRYLIITDKPITDVIDDVYEKSIYGYAYAYGSRAVVSTDGLKTDNDSLFTQRVIKVCLHEIGHNLGYHHCHKTYKCLMNVDRGLKGIDGHLIWICDDCKRKLKN